METLCHPRLDLVAVRVVSPLLRQGRIAIRIRFPYGTGQATAADWTPAGGARDGARPPSASERRARAAPRRRPLPASGSRWAPAGDARREGEARLRPRAGAETATPWRRWWPSRPLRSAEPLPGFDETRRAAREHWNRFWTTGGAIDLSGSRDPRWRELERRIVLSQYLTAIQCAGRYPPQETGLTYNSWEGKFHLEMHWWHAAHFALWGRLAAAGAEPRLLLGRSCRAPGRPRGARATPGARWPKMTSPSGAESPSTVGPFLVWQQPHPIFYAELVYRAARRPRDARAVPGRRLRDGRVHGVLRDVGRGHPTLRARPGPAGRAGDLPEGPHPQHAPSSSPTGAGDSRPRSTGASGSGLAREPRGSGSSTGSRRSPSATASTSSPRPRPRATPTRTGRAIIRR